MRNEGRTARRAAEAVTGPVCIFRCHDTTCLQSWTFVCNGLPDCPDNSDEIHCPPKLLRSNIHYSSFPNGQNIAGIQNVSAIQIVIIAISVVFTLGLITCVLSHYKMGARSWSERRNRSPLKNVSRDFHDYFHVSRCSQNLKCHCFSSLSSSQMQKVMPVPIDLPLTVSTPNEERSTKDKKTLHVRDSEIYRSYIRPPPNRTVLELETTDLWETSSVELYPIIPPPVVCHSLDHRITFSGHENDKIPKWQERMVPSDRR